MAVRKTEEREGRVKYADVEKGYGYIVDDEADDPTVTTYFSTDVAELSEDELVPGAYVSYQVFADDAGGPAAKVSPRGAARSARDTGPITDG